MITKHPLDDCEGFDWDEGNIQKNWQRHKVNRHECEDVFFNPRLVLDDLRHSQSEMRYTILGNTNMLRHLLIVVTIRRNKIRIISARDMNKKEREKYEQAIKTNPKV